MESLGNRFKDFLGERRTSPMYKAFLFSWCLRNWNFLYTLIAEDGDKILAQHGTLKSEYLAKVYEINWDIVLSRDFYTVFASWGFWHAFLGPILSVLLFYFILNHIELWVRKRANQNQIDQIDADKKLQESKNKAQNTKNDGANAELEAIRIKNKQLEEERIKMVNEIEKAKISKEIKKELTEEEKRDIEYEKFKKITEFEGAIQGLLHLNNKSRDEYGLIYEVYGIGYNDGLLGTTEKGKYFLKQRLEKDRLPFG